MPLDFNYPIFKNSTHESSISIFMNSCDPESPECISLSSEKNLKTFKETYGASNYIDTHYVINIL